jgi:hypothetical protein
VTAVFRRERRLLIGLKEVGPIRMQLVSSVLRYEQAPTIVSGLPLAGDHPMHPFIVDAKGSMYVDVATATNSCQVKNRTLKSPGVDPCTELETRGGIWLGTIEPPDGNA